jgi:hypothetical protein
MPRSSPPKRSRLTPNDQLELLWDLRRELASSPTLKAKDVLPRVASLLVRSFAEYCAVELRGAKGRLEGLAVLHADQKKRHLLAAMASSGDVGAIEAKLGATSRLTLPVTANREPVGVLTLLNANHERPFDRSDARFARELTALLSLFLTRSAASPSLRTSSRTP